MIQQLFQAHCQGIKGLAGACHSFDDHQRSLVSRLHQRFLKKILTGISGSNPVGLTFPVFQFPDHTFFHSAQMGLFLRLIRLQNHKLIFRQLRGHALTALVHLVDLFHRNALLFKILKQFLRHVYLASAGVLLLLLQYLLRHKILRRQSQQLGFQPEKKILRHKDHLAFQGLGKAQTHLQYTIVHGGIRKILRQLHIHKIFLHPENAPGGKADTLQQIPLLAKLLQIADHLPGIGPPLALRLFQAVQLLNHRQRQDNLVILKTFRRVGRLDQNIGVNHINFAHMVYPS